ncbi:hypothetical protein JTF04_03585 [Mammaliicoccus vitulinus]|uniref:hypothetical protein n=1 Tax=Mammaliicoccus vitulinus TaxID=71237 RepID=UPI00194E8157|nr:hypothetical protein [Mammaliicoccus vitulinus]MBM6628754.1 hypothetical protein [Mammaliicoccus vitulinus]MBO3076769.1 hypothetical protein [Mammaliicoccus vitulinus]
MDKHNGNNEELNQVENNSNEVKTEAEDKVFTQDELEEIIKDRIAREKRNADKREIQTKKSKMQSKKPNVTPK